jgi:hypothetical protein
MNPDLRLCGAKTRDGTPCELRAGFGTEHVGFGRCRFHAGRSPSGNLAAERQRLDAQAADAASTFGLPRDVDPAEALGNEVNRSQGHVDWLGARLAETDTHDLTSPRTLALHEGYLRERQHLARVAKAALDAGVAERRVRITEAQSAMFDVVLGAILSDLGHDVDDRRVRNVVARRMAQAAGIAPVLELAPGDSDD